MFISYFNLGFTACMSPSVSISQVIRQSAIKPQDFIKQYMSSLASLLDAGS